ncbi:MAG TPA: hypothetical protein VGF67_05400 [Ktedonobacteraceae bacterium]
MHKSRAGHDGKPDLVESFPHPLGGGLSCPTLGMAGTPSCDLLLLLCQSGTHHAFPDGDDLQGDGKAGE